MSDNPLLLIDIDGLRFDAIQTALEKNLVPHWDAANEASVKLALKLGYTNPVSWDAYYYTKGHE